MCQFWVSFLKKDKRKGLVYQPTADKNMLVMDLYKKGTEAGGM